MKTIQEYKHPGKYEVKIPFSKSGEEKEFLGIVDGRVQGEYELEVVAEHSVSETRGRVVVRAVVGVGSIVKLSGIIRIEKEAQKTDDFLELRILLLDKTARGFVEPKLEILANEVKASHAASVGKVDEEQLLYLMSRGLARDLAKEVIVEGFLKGE